MSNHNKLIFISLFIASVLLRLSKVLPNFEFVTTSLVISSLYFSKKQSLGLILAIMAVTDLILGNTNIFLFTWTGFALPIIFIKYLLRTPNVARQRRSEVGSVLIPTSLGLFSNLFFYLWTNFGVWFLDSWGMYPKTLAGLVFCYINGLPFLQTQLESTLILLPLTLIVIHTLSSSFLPKLLYLWRNWLRGHTLAKMHLPSRLS